MKTKPTEIYSAHDWWKQTGRKTVADYLENAVEDFEVYVIEVEGNSFLALLLDDLDSIANPKFKQFTVTLRYFRQLVFNLNYWLILR